MHFIITILLITMLVVTIAVAQETSSVESTATRPEDDYSIAGANALLFRIYQKIGYRKASSMARNSYQTSNHGFYRLKRF